ncbi:MAG: ComEC/Rec2 family competence protein [Treponema sp.]|nr:ComEC/Rec2 family competence protein [Treponema sp.]
MGIKQKLEYFFNPIFLSVFICLLFFYLPKNEINLGNNLKSLVEKESITKIYCYIENSPSKVSSGKSYMCKARILEIQDKNGIKASAFGKVNLLIPSKMVEAYYPGKLYSLNKGKNFLYEAGAYFYFEGNLTGDFFNVKKCLDSFWPENIYGRVDYFRALCRLQFKRMTYAWGKAGALLLSLLSGSREYLDKKVGDIFRNAGLSHILALSGMHLSIFTSLAVFIGKKLKSKKATYILQLITLFLFVWFAGFSPSLLRAFIFSSLLFISLLAGYKKPDLLITLAFTFLLQVIISPEDIYSIAFKLSYGALTGILLFSDLINGFLEKLIPEKISSSISASTAAQLFTGPICIKAFGALYPIGIISSLFISPLISFFIILGLILIILTLLLPVLLPYSEFIMNILYNLIILITGTFAKAPRINF